VYVLYHAQVGILRSRCVVREGPLLNLQEQVPFYILGGAYGVNCIAFISLLNKGETSSRQGLRAMVHHVTLIRLA
jgi:hypothetical protein